MAIYLIFYSWNIFLFNLAGSKSKIISNIINIILFFTVFLFSGLRGSVGSDTPNYISYFQISSTTDNILFLFSKFEPLFVIFTSAIRSITDSNFVFIISYSAFQAFLLICIYLKIKNKLFVLVYILIFYLNFHFNTLRAGTAALLLLYYLTENRRNVKILISIIAPLFHVSILFFYPFFVIKFKPKYLISLLIIILFTSFFTNLFETFSSKALFYEDYLIEYKSNTSILPILIIIYLSFSIFIMKGSSSLYKKSAHALILTYILQYFYPSAYRLTILAQLFYLYFLLENLNNNYFQKIKFLVFWPFFSLLFMLHIYGLFNENKMLTNRINNNELTSDVLDSTMIPYKFYWNDSIAKNIQ